MMRAAFVFTGLLLLASGARAAETCEAYTKLGELPTDFRALSVAAIGPARLTMMSSGKCTCNDMPTVQRHLGQAEPEGVNWACDVADPEDAKGK